MGEQSKYFIVNENLVKLRKALGLTQEEFSSEIKIKRSLLGAYEEHRAEVSNVVVKTLVFKGFLLKTSLYDFVFKREFKPAPKQVYKKVWSKSIVKVKQQVQKSKSQ